MDYSARLLHLQELMQEERIEAVLVIAPENCEYLIGTRGHELFDITLLITQSSVRIICSPLYREALNATALDVIPWSPGLKETLKSQAERLCITQLSIEGHRLTWAMLRSLEAQLAGIHLQDSGKLIEKLRLIKDAEEIDLISRACAITDESLSSILPLIREGMTESHIAWMIEQSMRDQGADDVSFRPLIVAAGKGSSEPHHVPGEYKVQHGDMVQFDIGARYRGYGADLSRVAVLGGPSVEQTRLYEHVLKVQEYGIALVHSGADGVLIDEECKKMVENAGYPRYPHGLGHGIGLAPSVHEDPFLSSRLTTPVLLRAGMVLTVEPGIYVPGAGGVRIEDVVLVQEGGAGQLSHADKSLIVLS